MTRPLSRPAFMLGTAAAAAAAAAPGAVRAQTPAEVPLRVAIDPAAAGTPIPPGFLGLGFGSELLADPTFFNAGNTSVVGLFRALGPGVVRIAGTAVDRVVFSNEALPPGSDRIAIGPSDVSRLAAFLNAAGWNAIYGLDFAHGTPDAAAGEAGRVAGTLAARLAAFEIGSEPDRYAAAGVRPAGYAFGDWFREWTAFQSAVALRAPAARFCGPDAVSSAWVAQFAAAFHGASPLSQHVYAQDASTATIDRLLAPNPDFDQAIAALASAARTSNASFRVTETNTAGGSGKRGVSDTFAAALWAVDALFRIAAAGGSGANVHASRDGLNAPWSTDASGTHDLRPLYYGLAFFARASRGALVFAAPSQPALNLGAYAVKGTDGATMTTLVNKDAAQDARVTIDAGRALTRVTVVRLRAPAIDSIRGVTLAGSPVALDGSSTPQQAETVVPSGATVAIRVPYASAALVTLT